MQIHLALKPWLSIITLAITFFQSTAQIDTLANTIDDVATDNQVLLEDLIQSTESEVDFDFNTIYEQLEAYRANPLNINKASQGELNGLGLLSPNQVANFIRYRETLGELIALEELQAVPGFNLETINRILPFVTVKGGLDDYRVSINEMIGTGRDELYLRWNLGLQNRRGFDESVNPESRFLGDPNRFYARFKHSYSNKLSYGITAEKDPGEPFFRGVNRNEGFDFYSAHIFLKDYSSALKAIAIGDFAVSFGQGLLLHSGYGFGKSNLVMNIKKSARTLRPYTSVSETGFMRGVGATVGLGEHVEVTAFGSYVGRDGNLIEQDTLLDPNNDFGGITSLLNTGLHRNLREIEDQNAIQQLSIGGNVKYSRSTWHIAANVIYDRFDQPLQRNIQPYNQFFFNGQTAFNASLDYSIIIQNINFFGETAISRDGVPATLNGVLLALDRKVDFALLHRYFPVDYVALNANVFGETSQARNESGLYLGIFVRPANRWEWSAYFDLYEHPWLRFRTDAPSRGYDWRTRLRFYKKRDVEAYLQVRFEEKLQNTPDNTTKTDLLSPIRAFQARIHLSKKVNKALEVRTRLDWGFNDSGQDSPRTEGFSLLQDILYKPIEFPISFSTRFAIFDTGGFNTRFYHYENNLLYTFAIPAYYNRGTRFYFNIRYRGIPNLTLEARYDQTVWNNTDGFSSGLEEIEGNIRSNVSAQIKYKF